MAIKLKIGMHHDYVVKQVFYGTIDGNSLSELSFIFLFIRIFSFAVFA